MRVLLIEDDPTCAKAVESSLASEGYFCEVMNSAQDSYCSVIPRDSNYYDIVILDIHFPGKIDGYDILVQLREAQIKVPVIILSCISSIAQKVKGFYYGADDYMTKPFHKSELLARVKAIVRRTKGHPESVIRIGHLTINLDSKRVTCGDVEVSVTNKEFIIVKVLGENCDKVVSKEQLVCSTYSCGDEPGDDKIIDVFICKLRKKLRNAAIKFHATTNKDNGEIDNNPEVWEYIETVWGRGYILKSPPAAIEQKHAVVNKSTYNEDLNRKYMEEQAE